MIVFDFSEFKIGKELTLEVTDPSLVDEGREQFLHRKSDALDRIKRTRQEVKNRDSIVVPGPKFANFRYYFFNIKIFWKDSLKRDNWE